MRRDPVDPAIPDGDTFRQRLDTFRSFAGAYGVEPRDHEELVDAIIESRDAGGSFVRRRAEAGDPVFATIGRSAAGRRVIVVFTNGLRRNAIEC